MWPCSHARKHFSDAIDGQPLPLLTRAHVGMHRSLCPFCRRYEKSLHHTLQAGRLLKDLPFEGFDEEAATDAPKKP